jgi:hypothetical protein
MGFLHMPKIKSLREKIEELGKLLESGESSGMLNDFEYDFINSMAKYKEDTTKLTEKQVTCLDRIYTKRIGGW